jgi:hypothetical protein
MTDLSPAAQAVLNAVTLKRYDVPYFACPRSIDQIKSDVAAALRAVVHHLAYETQLDDPMMTTIHVVDADDLDAIAAELEALPND